jgi:hypothetical protein
MRIAWSILALMTLLVAARTAAVEVDAHFPGGNVVVDRIDGDNVYVRPDLRDTAGDWFYWNFRVRSAGGRMLTVHFTKGNPIGVRGPAVSIDGGKRWRWLGADAVHDASFKFTVPADADDVRFAFAFPYQQADLRAFLDRFKDNPHLRVEELAKTTKGRRVDVVRLGRIDGKAEHRVALTCRHHCCESMASFELEGLMETVLADNRENNDGEWLRQHVEFFIVPIVDLDGVEDGDQGKNRRPRDHGRDYAGESIYPQVKAIRERLRAWSDGKLRVALDLHCPHIRGTHNEWIYFVGGPDQDIWREVGRFSEVLERVRTGPLPHKRENNLPFGQAWNKPANFVGGMSFARWAGELPGVRVASTIEFPYANVEGHEVTGETARAFGRDLARTARHYLDAPAK